MIGEDLMRCSTGHGEFAVRSDDVRHVARAEQLRDEAAADGRVGALSLGSQLVPVFSLEQTLGLTAHSRRTQADQHIAVTGEGANLVGWLVDQLTREPASGVKMSPMPPAVGGRACQWFEAVVRYASGDVGLLLDPRQLSPLGHHAVAAHRHAAAFTSPALGHVSSAEPVALLFSTAAFPSSAIDKFALSGRQVAAIVQPTGTVAVPGCAPHVSGLMIWRDAAVPIVDYRANPRDQSRQWRRLIARCGARSQWLVAFAIDDEVVMHRPGADNRPIDGAAGPPFASVLFDVNGDRVALLDLDALVPGLSG